MWSPPRTDAIEKPKPIKARATVVADKLEAYIETLQTIHGAHAEVLSDATELLNEVAGVTCDAAMSLTRTGEIGHCLRWKGHRNECRSERPQR